MTTPDSSDLQLLLQTATVASKRKKRRLLAVAACALALVAFALVLPDREADVLRFETAEVRRGDIEVTISATGKVQGVNTVEVGAEVSGRVLEVLVDHNHAVKVGQLLARIDPEQAAASKEEAGARLLVAEANARQAVATRDEAEANLRRAEAQREEGLISRQEFDAIRAAGLRAEAQVASSQAQLRLERANLASASSRLDRTEIRSPIDGIILSRLVEPGQTVTAGFQTPILFKVTADLRRIRVHARVDESDVGKVEEGQRARFTVDAWPERSFEARVEAVRHEPLEDQTVVAYETLLSVDNAEGLLRPGMTASVTIVVDERKDALLVPNAALRFQPPGGGSVNFSMPGMPRTTRRAAGPKRPKGPVVWLESEERGASPNPRSVRVLATDGKSSEVSADGLEPGMKVIVNLAEGT